MSNIEDLIETVKETSLETTSRLDDSITWNEIMAELLTDIKLSNEAIRDVLFKQFEFSSDVYRENQLAEIERLRELKGAFAGAVQQAEPSGVGAPVEQKQDATTAAAVGFVGGAAGASVLGSLLGFVKRLGPLVGLFAAGGAVLTFLENLRDAKSTGTPDATMEAVGATAGDIYDAIGLPVLQGAVKLLADELQLNKTELENANIALVNFRGSVEKSSEDLFRDLKRFLGEETATEAQLESQARIERLQQQEQFIQAQLPPQETIGQAEQELAVVQQRLQELTPQAARQAGASAVRERNQLVQKEKELLMTLAPSRALRQTQIQLEEERRGAELAQRGFEAGEVQTPMQLSYQSLPSSEKDAYFEKNIDPQLQSAIESGAVEKTLGTSTIAELGGLFDYISAIPLKINSINALEQLSPKQLEAILVNDQILNKSVLQTGAMDTSDRNIVKAIYLKKISAEPQTSINSPNDLTPVVRNMEAEMGPIQTSGRTYDVTPNGLLSAPVARASSEVAAAQASTPIVIAPSRGGDVVNNNVQNNTTNVIPAGAPSRSNSPSYLRLQDRMQSAS